jgi:hypothetical protein
VRISERTEWDLVVPVDDAELADRFRSQGVKPGQRVHVTVLDSAGSGAAGEQLPAFFASFDGPADLATRSSEILRSRFPGAR